METVNETLPPSGPPPSQHPDPRLTRATNDKVVSGLAGGLGRYFGIDPVVFRIAFVVLALAGGSGVLLYLVGWAMIPDDHGRNLLHRVGRERDQKLVAAVLAGVGVLVLFDQLGRRNGGDVPAGLVLVGIGALVLWNRHTDGGHRPPSGTEGPGGPAPFAPPAPPPPPPLPGPSPRPEPGAGPAMEPDADAGTAAFPGEAVPARPAKPPKPPSALLPVTLSLLAVLAGGLALLGVSATTGLALALLVTGGGLLLGAWRGRARWLIPMGLSLAVALAAASVIDVPVRGGSGDIRFRPVTVDEVSTPYRLAAGHLTLDLGALDLAGSTVTVVASVAAGHLEVIVPDGAAVELEAHVGAGDINVLARHDDGFDVSRRVDESGVEGGGRLVLRARAGAGAVEVRRAQA